MRDYLELTKPRITILILICTAVGYWFGCGNSFHLSILVHALLGTALLASGTSALNQWYEVDSDARMRRTRKRPLPAGKNEAETCSRLRRMLSAAGFADLWYGTNLLTAALGLFTLLSYLFLYTPLKRLSRYAPQWARYRARCPPHWLRRRGPGLDAGALALFLILFVWQFPHFDAIAWMYREDYAPRRNPDAAGDRTGRRIDGQARRACARSC